MSKRVNALPPGHAILPASVRAAWGFQRPSGRGPRPTLSLDRIVIAAVNVASLEGIEAVAMHRVARELGVGTMSLYRHVASKEDLLALMADSVFDRVPSARPRERWRAALARWAREHLAVLRQHSWVLRIPISGPPLTPNQVRWFECGLACLAGTGLTETQKPAVLLLLNGFVRNHATLEADLAAAASRASEETTSYGKQLATVVDAEHFPAISALLAAHVFDGPDGLGADFDFGLERILDGIAAIVRRRR
jgi:AcrR family transcriptional regulator